MSSKSNIDRVILVRTTTILKVVGILAVLGFLYLIRDIVALVCMALFLTAILHPPARFFEKWKIPRGVTVIGFYAFFFSIAVVSVWLLLPPLIDQSSTLIAQAGKSWSVLSDGVASLKSFSEQYGLSNDIRLGVQSLEGQFTKAATGLFSTLTDFFGGLVGLIVVLVMAYYMVAQEQDARNAFRQLMPPGYQDRVLAILKHVEEKMGKWLLGQILLCIIIGLLYFVGLSVAGVPSAFVLAIFGGFTEFIPYVGPILGAVPAVLVGMSQSPWHALFVLVVMVVIQQFEGHIIVPKVMQKTVGLNPLISIIALLIGAKLFGLVGALLSIPVATALLAVYEELTREGVELADFE